MDGKDEKGKVRSWMSRHWEPGSGICSSTCDYPTNSPRVNPNGSFLPPNPRKTTAYKVGRERYTRRGRWGSDHFGCLPWLLFLLLGFSGPSYWLLNWIQQGFRGVFLDTDTIEIPFYTALLYGKAGCEVGLYSYFSRPKHIYWKLFYLLCDPSMRHLILWQKIEQNKTAPKKQGSGG